METLFGLIPKNRPWHIRWTAATWKEMDRPRTTRLSPFNSVSKNYVLSNCFTDILTAEIVTEQVLKFRGRTCIQPYNRPFPSCLVPRFESESWCIAFHMEMVSIHMQIKLIFIWEVLHGASLWKRGTRQLENGLLWLHQPKKSVWTCLFGGIYYGEKLF